jgi:hypothetical protein
MSDAGRQEHAAIDSVMAGRGEQAAPLAASRLDVSVEAREPRPEFPEGSSTRRPGGSQRQRPPPPPSGAARSERSGPGSYAIPAIGGAPKVRSSADVGGASAA